jgi:uncharacterized protein (TIRG00374 family)
MKIDWRGLLGIALSALLLWWTLHNEPLHEVWRALTASNLPLLVFAAVVATCIFPLRARRWRPILDPVAPNLPFGPLWRATAIGMMVNNVVPARAGELARAFALTRETERDPALPRVPFPTAFASLAVDRLFDAVVVLGLMFGAMLDPAFPPDTRIAGQPISVVARSGILMIGALVVLLYAIVVFPDRVISAYEVVARRIAPRLEARGKLALRAFAEGLGVLRHPRRFGAVLGWAVLHWLVHALSLWIGFRAVGIDAPFSAALFLQGVLALAVAIPSSPGFFGVFEGAAKVGLTVYGVDQTLAVSWALGMHILSFIPITVMGAWYFARLGLRMGDVRAAGSEPAPRSA